METEILNKEVNEKIDWSKPQWVVATDYKNILFTSGKHEGNMFEGTCLPCDGFPKGSKDNWNKSYFKPIPEEGLLIKIKNK
jgi:hypothetical protein